MVTELQSAIELKPCIVRIRRSNGMVVGAGFLVGEKHILTCAHVVAEALGIVQDQADPPEETVQLDFPLLAPGKNLRAQVVMWQPPRPDGRGDIAGLQLDTLPPPEASPAHLVAAENLWGHSFRAFGFPRGNEDGTWASGTLLDRQAAGWVQIEDVKETGYRVQPGFSGTPVWDDDLEGVVGMVVAAEARAEIKAAFTIPTDVLLASWPEMDQLSLLPCPYQGLRAFQQQHASYFFGREGFTEQLVQAVQEQSLTAVVGPSGSGKSSVVFAGLLPRLRREGNWVIISSRPGREPFQELATSLIPALELQMSETDQLIERNKLVRALRSGAVHLHEVVERILGKQAESSRLLLVCDQFEELYTLGQNAEERIRYLDELLQAVAALSQHREPPFSLVLTLRADFFGHASSYRPFADALQDSMLILGPMNRKELQDAIEKPVHSLGVRIEEGLSERLLEAVGEEPGNLPLLEFALTELWSRRRRRMLTHAAYEDIGGVKQALAVHAEEAFRKLDPQEEQRVRRIFTQLVQPSQATEDTRRIATESELGRENWKLVARLADERLVVTGRDEAIGEETAEIVHEALIREWERLRQWTNDDREFRQWQERLRAAIRQWEVSERDKGALLRGGVLAEAERWVEYRGGELAEAERDYILTSTSMQEQERVAGERLRRRIISGLAIGLGVALILALLAGWQWLEAEAQTRRAEAQEQEAVTQKQEAEKQRREAETQRQVAEGQRNRAEAQRRVALSRQLAAQTISLISQGLLDRALLLSQEALRASETTEARDALMGALQYNPRLITFLRGHDGWVESVNFSPDSRILASVVYDSVERSSMILWDPQKRQRIGEPLKGVSSIAFSPDSKILASGGYESNGSVILWDTQRRQRIGEPLQLPGDSGVNSVAFSPDGKILAFGGGDSSVILWDPQRGQRIGEPLQIPGSGVNSVAFSPDSKILASVVNDSVGRSSVILWDIQRRQRIGEPLQIPGLWVNSIAFSPDSKILSFGGYDGSVILWDIQRRQQLAEPLQMPGSSVSSIAFSPDSKILASVVNDSVGRSSVILWDPQKRQQLGEPFQIHGSWVSSIAFSPDSKILAFGGYDGSVILWDTQRRQRIGEPLQLPGDSGGNSVAFSPDGRILALGGYKSNGSVILWDTQRGQRIGEFLQLPGDSGVNSIAFSPDGRILAFGGDNGSVILWDIQRRQQLGELLQIPGSWVNSIAFSPDSKILASVVNDSVGRSSVILWDPQKRQQLGEPFQIHGSGVSSIAFSPNGKILVSGGDNGSVILWDVDIESWKERACRTTNRNLTRSEWKQYLENEPYHKTCSNAPEGG